MTTAFTVFLVRHGERLDEALKRKGLPFTPALKADPPLTKQGYSQAFHALGNLLTALEADGKPRKIAVFASPLRRTIGTSFMLAPAIMSKTSELPDSSSCLEFGLHQSSSSVNMNDITTTAATTTTTTIPIMVLNGLGSCAAYCKKRGGADRLAEAGQIPCADVPSNNGSPSSPMFLELQRMQKVYQENPCEIPLRNQTTNRRVLQYCKLLRRSGTLHPMAPPVQAQEIESSSSSSSFSNSTTNDEKQKHSRVFGHACRQSKSEEFQECLDRAVRIAREDGCDTLIAVTHREAINALVTKWGLHGKPYTGHPYCCIGVFQAILLPNDDDGHDQQCQWLFEGVFPFEEFDKQCIPQTSQH